MFVSEIPCSDLVLCVKCVNERKTSQSSDYDPSSDDVDLVSVLGSDSFRLPKVSSRSSVCVGLWLIQVTKVSSRSSVCVGSESFRLPKVGSRSSVFVGLWIIQVTKCGLCIIQIFKGRLQISWFNLKISPIFIINILYLSWNQYFKLSLLVNLLSFLYLDCVSAMFYFAIYQNSNNINMYMYMHQPHIHGLYKRHFMKIFSLTDNRFHDCAIFNMLHVSLHRDLQCAINVCIKDMLKWPWTEWTCVKVPWCQGQGYRGPYVMLYVCLFVDFITDTVWVIPVNRRRWIQTWNVILGLFWSL